MSATKAALTSPNTGAKAGNKLWPGWQANQNNTQTKTTRKHGNGVMMTMFDGQVTEGFDVRVVSDKALAGIRAATRARGILSREEAEFLFLIDRTGFVGGPDWFPDAVKAVSSFVVWDRSPSGHVT
ncbi:MAG: hypothetical protein ACRC7C_17215, partial [Beijerinckiaceae bacterium]